MRRLGIAVVVWLFSVGALVEPADAAVGSPTFVFQVRFAGLVANASWTTCPSPVIGDVCTDTLVMAFDATTTEKIGPEPKIRHRGPVLNTMTFVYRVVGGEFGTVPVAEWFGRTEDAAVSGTPRLTRATAAGTVPISVCSVFEPGTGIACPEVMVVDLVWTGTGPLVRTSDHTVFHGGVRTENTWTRGWERSATVNGRVGTEPLGTLLVAGLARIDQGETVVQHPVV
jgi:hypothetical protein